MTKRPILLWLRQDLRLTDNRALAAAIEAGGRVIPVFVLDDPAAGEWAIGAASRGGSTAASAPFATSSRSVERGCYSGAARRRTCSAKLRPRPAPRPSIAPVPMSLGPRASRRTFALSSRRGVSN